MGVASHISVFKGLKAHENSPVFDVGLLALYNRIRETEGLPLIPVVVCGCTSTVMIDSGSCLNLVGEQFVRNVYKLKAKIFYQLRLKSKG